MDKLIQINNEQLDNIINTLSKHSYDDHRFCLRYIKDLYKADIELDNIISYYRHKLAKEMNNETYCLKQDIIDLLKIVDKNLIFVYGTLMSSEISHYMLEDSEYIGEGLLEGYGLIELDGYPGMIKQDNKVLGEVYRINDKIKSILDEYEEDEYSYESNFITINGYTYHVHFYQYILEPNIIYIPSKTNNYRWVSTTKLLK